MRSGVPHRRRLPGQPGWGTSPNQGDFSPGKRLSWATLPTWGELHPGSLSSNFRASALQNNMAAVMFHH